MTPEEEEEEEDLFVFNDTIEEPRAPPQCDSSWPRCTGLVDCSGLV
jgi:hypothetical protein